MQHEQFYSDIQSFQDFNAFADDLHYHELPSDWSVIITDIRGSTLAIQQGRYKDVNTMGVATIVATTKAMKKIPFPYVFGGDGATLLVPNSHLEEVLKSLHSLQALSLSNYGLTLRVGTVSMSDLKRDGFEVKVAKHELNQRKSIALLKGNGIAEAEKRVKDPSSHSATVSTDSSEADLNGLSCRWNAIPSKQGIILSLLIKSRTGDAPYRDFLELLHRQSPGGIESLNPVHTESMNYKSFFELIHEEKRLHRSRLSPFFMLRVLEIAIAVFIFRFGINPGFFDPNRYQKSMRSHSDFLKYDDLLRMVIDCTETQKVEILNHLESAFREHKLYYGISESRSSLMTCFVETGLDDGGHIHFIDAENGGYAAAALLLKEQIKHSTSNLNR